MSKPIRALLSVTDKTGVVDFARRLEKHGVAMISTGGTAKVLREAGLDVADVSEVTGFPEMLDGRVKTIHPRIAAGILAIRSRVEHMNALKDHEIGKIDIVVVNLYEFEKVAARPDATFDELIENIDIGGPTLIRAAAKNFTDVAVVTDPADYNSLGDEMDERGGEISQETRWRLAQRAFALTAAYDRAVSAKLQALASTNSAESLPELLDISVRKKTTLRYGENPHQAAALYRSGQGGVAAANKLHGKELSYNNLVDLDAAWQLVHEFEKPAAAIIKHTNPCGCAEQETLAEAYARALECDPASAFGSVIAVNRELDAETAGEISKLFVEAVAAPRFSEGALEILTAKKNLRVIEVGDAAPQLMIKSISGGYLAQSPDAVTQNKGQSRVVTERKPTAEELDAMAFAWKVAKHVKSNAIVYARAGQCVGVGAGQMSRVDAAKLGASKAVLPLKGSVVGSDAFFPFPDGLEEVAGQGATAVIQPGGSVRDQEVIDAANKLGLAMVFTEIRHFRH